MSTTPDYQSRFKSCGHGVVIEPGVYIEHPEVMEVGDGVRFRRGFYMMDRPRTVRIGSHVNFYPNCFIQGRAELTIGDHVDFFPGTYISLGVHDHSFTRIGHHTHFAPRCVLYGNGGLTIGNYCNMRGTSRICHRGSSSRNHRSTHGAGTQQVRSDRAGRRRVDRRHRHRHR